MAEVVPEYEEMIRKRLEWLSQGKADVQEACVQIDGIIICLPVLMLCRVAIDRGMVLAERPYVPLSLLPNYTPTGSDVLKKRQRVHVMPMRPRGRS